MDEATKQRLEELENQVVQARAEAGFVFHLSTTLSSLLLSTGALTLERLEEGLDEALLMIEHMDRPAHRLDRPHLAKMRTSLEGYLAGLARRRRQARFDST